MIHYLLGEALRDYLHCPQEFAYRHLYRAPEPPRTRQQLWDRAVRRTALSLVKERLEGRPLTLDRLHLFWQLITAGTPISSIPNLEITGRAVLQDFWSWLEQVEPKGLMVTRQVTFEVSVRRQIEVEFTADFTGLLGGHRVFVLLAPPAAGILAQLAACDTNPWVIYDLSSGPSTPKRVGPSDRRKIAGVVEQGFRGIGHYIVWAHRDARCTPCPYADICTPGDARRYLLRTSSKQKRVLERIVNQRKLTAPRF